MNPFNRRTHYILVATVVWAVLLFIRYLLFVGGVQWGDLPWETTPYVEPSIIERTTP